MKTNELRDRIYPLLRAIPAGQITSYGELAKFAGAPGCARQVGAILRKLPKDSRLPWFKVLQASGKIAFAEGTDAFNRQRDALRDDGIEVNAGRVASRFRWQP